MRLWLYLILAMTLSFLWGWGCQLSFVDNGVRMMTGMVGGIIIGVWCASRGLRQ